MTGICGPVSFLKHVRNRHSMAYGSHGVYGIPGLDAHRLRIHFYFLGVWPKQAVIGMRCCQEKGQQIRQGLP